MALPDPPPPLLADGVEWSPTLDVVTSFGKVLAPQFVERYGKVPVYHPPSSAGGLAGPEGGWLLGTVALLSFWSSRGAWARAMVAVQETQVRKARERLTLEEQCLAALQQEAAGRHRTVLVQGEISYDRSSA